MAASLGATRWLTIHRYLETEDRMILGNCKTILVTSGVLRQAAGGIEIKDRIHNTDSETGDPASQTF